MRRPAGDRGGASFPALLHPRCDPSGCGAAETRGPLGAKTLTSIGPQTEVYSVVIEPRLNTCRREHSVFSGAVELAKGPPRGIWDGEDWDQPPVDGPGFLLQLRDFYPNCTFVTPSPRKEASFQNLINNGINTSNTREGDRRYFLTMLATPSEARQTIIPGFGIFRHDFYGAFGPPVLVPVPRPCPPFSPPRLSGFFLQLLDLNHSCTCVTPVASSFLPPSP